jgi:hypothetical protein
MGAMRCRAPIVGGLAATLALTIGCDAFYAANRGPGYYNGWENVTVNTINESPGHVLPPIGYQCYPHYFDRNGTVYDVHGLYYKEHHGDWSILRGEPTLVRYQTPVVSHERRCLEYPP